MGVRGLYDRELNELKEDILSMGDQVVLAFSQALSFLETREVSRINTFITDDEKVNKSELAIHDKVTMMIARQQPVATDLRVAIAALKIASDMERIGDLAVDIGKAAKRLSEETKIEDIQDIREMATIAEEMLTSVFEAYKNRDLMQAQQVAVMDDKVDDLYSRFIKKLFTSTDLLGVEQTTQLAFVGRYVERIADYATNLAEWVVYETNGKHFDLN
ncbi:phosphate signaling complex protein PhoU [Alteribacillus iranensis]|uniref:Phosphate-specific transport system accessory protein PhoU n=1 Tax=Alteribacillus iranensis TaxID=930128 RepID=A0A1I2CSR6_9BACI|nr:phosphate signaling complex protein PhoU [Alteribacillus iranensis]SFE71387.1 phosphate uptake regulator, PhoU [Alteribacillus iranensis]